MQPILTVDLSTKTTNHLIVPSEWGNDYLGGASLAARILFDVLVSGVEPKAAEAPLLFITGPLTGTSGPSVGRFVVCARSPATGLWGESNCGGFWGPALRKAGFDGLLITGKADMPVFIVITDDDVQIMDGKSIWGLDTYQTQEAVIEKTGLKYASVAVIGPAGERQSPMSVILTDHGRVAGRTGMGAVMGSKNLKAIAVQGKNSIPFQDPEYKTLRKEVNRILKEDNFTKVARELGTCGIADYVDYLGEMPKKYYQSGIFEGVEKVSGATMAETILVGVKACHACVIACGREVQIEGEERTQKGPEYEMAVGFGPNLGIDDLTFVTQMVDLTDRFGVDAISLSNTFGLAFTLYENGILTERDTGGFPLNWGNQTAAEELVRQTIAGEGLGNILIQGSRYLEKWFGVEDMAVQGNGLEFPYHDPRGASGMALSYATSPRGACHNQSDYFLVDLYGQVEESLGMAYYDRHAGSEKAGNVAIHQNWRTVFNSLVMCYFANVSPQELVKLINAVTGRNYTLKQLLQVGERAWNLKRVINNRLGLSRDNDRLPKPLLKAYGEGGSAGYVIPLEDMLSAY
jgi:aldehyde:ferredoxin oxidoreductase